MNLKNAVVGAILIAALAYFVFVVPRIENQEQVVPRASQK
jgi:hypothetical protein